MNDAAWLSAERGVLVCILLPAALAGLWLGWKIATLWYLELGMEPPRPPKTEAELRPDIRPCFEFKGQTEAFVDCVTGRRPFLAKRRERDD